MNHRVSSAIAAILAASAAQAAYSAEPAGQATESAIQIEEVVVTATRRSESLQDVPIAIQAVTAEKLQQLNVQTFEDYVKYLPNVVSAGIGPGQNLIFMRGLGAGTVGNQVSGGVGSFPNVAVYLDEQSMQTPGRNLDVYAADIERIEVLEGPQGTLFGAGAQAGVVRYITNKPDPGAMDAGVRAAYETTAHGDPSTKFEAFINLPVWGDRAAVRAVVYNDSRGGYIKNVPGTFHRSADGPGIQYYFNGVLPGGVNTLTNDKVVDDAYNPVTYKGFRLSGLVDFNDDWNGLLQYTDQRLQADGVFGYNPLVGDLEVQQYNKTSNQDEFRGTSLTVNGRLGMLKVVYSGGYLKREINNRTDYTNYANAFYGPYYQCIGGNWVNWNANPPGSGNEAYRSNPNLPAGAKDQPQCFSPSAVWWDIQTNTHQSHELRVSTPDDKRLRAIVGLYWEDFKVEDSANFLYAAPEAGFIGQKPAAGTTQVDPSRRPDADAFFNDITRGYKQEAIFGEISFDILPNLTATVGARHYSMPTYEYGSANSGYGCRYVTECEPAPYTKRLDTAGPDGTPLKTTFSGTTPKFNLTWRINDEAMVYVTYSEGFRPGGYNRGQGVIPCSSALRYCVSEGAPSDTLYYSIPLFYDTDTLENIELGWKTSWLDRRVQLNGAIYQMKWHDVQMTQFNPAVFGNLTFTGAGPDYRVRGIEYDLIWRATEGLTVASSASFNDSEQISDPCVVIGDGSCIRLVATGGPGSQLSGAPKVQGNLRLRYDFNFNDYGAYWQLAGQYNGESYSQVLGRDNIEATSLASYSIFAASFGIQRDNWGVELYGENLTDERAEVFKASNDYEMRITTNRPRTIGLRFNAKFGK